MANNKLKTGLPKGSFRCGDSHPNHSDYTFNGYSDYNGKHIEMWQSNSVKEKSMMLRGIRKRKGGKVIHRRMSMPRGFFKRGDRHPFYADILFWGYSSGNSARWLTVSKFDKEELRAAERRHEGRIYKNTTDLSPFEVGVVDEIYKYRARLQSCTGIRWHVDHTVPVSKGGVHRHSNLEVVPALWNERKSNSHSERLF